MRPAAGSQPAAGRFPSSGDQPSMTDSKPSKFGWPRYIGLLSPAFLCAARNASEVVQASNAARFFQTVCEA